jgi:AcrR family transcriptional regulator
LVQREELILNVTRDLLLDLGYHGLTMDRIAEAMEYSKGTIYQHFPCKEEVLTELGTRILQKRLAMFEWAAQFEGRTRERMVAIGEAGEIFVRLYPDNFRILQIIKAEVITRKVSEERLVKMKDAEYRVLILINGIVREAIERGDLVLSPGRCVEEMSFGLWAVTDGGYGNIVRGMPLDEIGIKDPFRSVMNVCEVLGDGYGWKPLTSEWDYQATRSRVRATLFADEMREIEQRDFGKCG